MSRHKIRPCLKLFTFDNELFQIEHEDITVKKSVEIDYNSYNHQMYSSIKELSNILKFLDFRIIKSGEIIFDSNESEYKNLNFRFASKIASIIKEDLNLSKNEKEEFEKTCLEFIEDNLKKMPYEMILAENIINNSLNFGIKDFEEMNIKTYEKIQIATNLLKKQVENTQN